MIKVKIDDEFVEWCFELDGIDDKSIKEIIEIVKQQTGATCTKEYITDYHEDYIRSLLNKTTA